MGLHSQHRAAYAAMYRGADETGLLTQQLAHLHLIAGLNHGIGRGADVHCQGNDDGIGLRELLQSQMLGVFLVFGGMNTAVEALVPLCTGFGHIGLDGVHIDRGVITQLNGLIQELPGSALLFQALVDLLPGAVLLGIDFTLAVLGAAALSVYQALGAVHNGADAAGDIEIALGAGAAGLLRQGHAVVSDVIQGIGCRKDWQGLQIRHGLHTETAGDDDHILRALGHDSRQLLFRLYLIAEEIHLGSSGDVFSLGFGAGSERPCLRLFRGVELFEALVAGHHKEVILPCEQAFQLFLAL